MANEAIGDANPFGHIDVGYNAAPFLGDINGDGMQDMLIGTGGDDGVKVYLNSGNNTWPTEAIGDANPFGHIDVYDAAPFLGDINGDGMQDMLVGTGNGNVKVYLNSGNNTWPTEAIGDANPFGHIDGFLLEVMLAIPRWY